jgi:hypothetical protein
MRRFVFRGTGRALHRDGDIKRDVIPLLGPDGDSNICVSDGKLPNHLLNPPPNWFQIERRE